MEAGINTYSLHPSGLYFNQKGEGPFFVDTKTRQVSSIFPMSLNAVLFRTAVTGVKTTSDSSSPYHG